MTGIKNYVSVIFGIAFSFLLSSCSAHSPFILKNTTDTDLVGSSTYPPYQGKVFITKQALPTNVAFTPIARIDVGKIWYGSSTDALASMANRARELGANAIVEAKTWHQPSGFSWAAPEGAGQAVSIKDLSALSSAGVSGDYY
jgi:hypothetical protein